VGHHCAGIVKHHCAGVVEVGYPDVDDLAFDCGNRQIAT